MRIVDWLSSVISRCWRLFSFCRAAAMPNESPQLNLGSLRSAMSLTLHTHHAARIWHGRAPTEERLGIVGLSGYVNVMNKMERGAERDDPYSDGWMLWLEDKLDRATREDFAAGNAVRAARSRSSAHCHRKSSTARAARVSRRRWRSGTKAARNAEAAQEAEAAEAAQEAAGETGPEARSEEAVEGEAHGEAQA
jgi:hypothetical protein